MASAALEPWQAAAPRRKRRPAGRRPRGREVVVRDLEAETEADCAVLLRRIREAGEDLLLSDFWSLALEAINSCLTKHVEQLKAPEGTLSEALGNLHLDSSPDESAVTPGSIPGETPVPGTCHWKCVCYGIGNFATCVIARHQLTFLLLFLEKYQIPRRHCWVYDPLFSQLEIAVLKSLGVTVLSENEEGRRSVCGEPTVFYMPHCGTALYNNLLCSNWSADALAKMLIIGNSFRGLEERLLARILQKNYAYIAKVLKGLEELELSATLRYTDTFNDTSIHWFPVHKLQQLPTDTWAFREEPDYQDCEDLEIIRNKVRAPLGAGCGRSSCPREDGEGGRAGSALLCGGPDIRAWKIRSVVPLSSGHAVGGLSVKRQTHRSVALCFMSSLGDLTGNISWLEDNYSFRGGLKYCLFLTVSPLRCSSLPPLLGHVDQTLQGGGHPGLLALDKHHSPVDVNDDAAKGVQLLPFVPLPDDRHENNVVLLGLGLNKVLEVHGHGAGGHADAPLGHVLSLPSLLHGLVLEVLPPLRVSEKRGARNQDVQRGTPTHQHWRTPPCS